MVKQLTKVVEKEHEKPVKSHSFRHAYVKYIHKH